MASALPLLSPSEPHDSTTVSTGSPSIASRQDAMAGCVVLTLRECWSRDGEIPSSSDRDPGQSAPTGSYGSEGYQPSKGGDGEPGGQGAHGTSASTVLNDCSDCTGKCDQNNECINAPKNELSSKGKCGCGGKGGDAGIGGPGGGGSFGVYVEGSQAIVSLSSSSIRAREGGDGATGQVGIDGVEGKEGEHGDEIACVMSCNTKWVANVCQCMDGTTEYLKGPPGGQGGKGGKGGDGGGGAGGPSIALLKLGGAKVSLQDTVLHVSTGGKAGDSDAAEGMAKEEYTVP